MASPFTTTSPVTFPAYAQNRYEAADRARSRRPMTQGQRGYLRDLMLRKGAAKGMDLQQADDMLDTWLGELTFDAASKAIDDAKTWLAVNAPVADGSSSVSLVNAPAVPIADVVPAGRYAVYNDDQSVNDLAFYKVDRPTEGRWAGRVFVKLIAGDDEQRLSWATTKSVLAKIAAAGAEAASARYGHEIGECGICGRQLTNDESRARGIGPRCAEKMAW
jgi:hypothetical protein